MFQPSKLFSVAAPKVPLEAGRVPTLTLELKMLLTALFLKCKTVPRMKEKILKRSKVCPSVASVAFYNVS